MNRKTVIVLVVLSGLSMPMPVRGQVDDGVFYFSYSPLYWNGALYRMNVDGTGVDQIVASEGEGGFGAILIDDIHGYLYTTQSLLMQRIVRCDLGGRGLTTIVEGDQSTGIMCFAVDPSVNLLFWITFSNATGGQTMFASDLDGNGRRPIATDFPSAGLVLCGVAPDPASSTLYWGTSLGGFSIRKSAYDGSGAVGFDRSGYTPVVVDQYERTMYVAMPQYRRARKIRLDGSGYIDIQPYPGWEPRFIPSFDHVNRYMYYTSQDRDIVRCNLDGADQTVIIENFVGGWVTLLPAARRGDANSDGSIDTGDIPGFVSSLLGNTSGFSADVNGDGRADGNDVAPFISSLLTGD